MQTSSFFNPLPSLVAPFPSTLNQPKLASGNKHSRVITMTYKKDGRSGKMVDENMIVLRERIRKVKQETKYDNGDNGLPNNWMEWEKTYVSSGSYHSDVLDAVAFIQRFLMECRPSIALGMVAVLAFGGSTMAVIVLQCLINSLQGN